METILENVGNSYHNTTVTENVQSVHPQLCNVTFKIPSQPCRLVPEAGCPTVTATLSV